MSTEISRRNFLGGALGLGALGVLHGSGSARVLSPLAHLVDQAGTAKAGGKTLVLVTLYGGNDGLNTLVPYENSAYYSSRGSIAIPGSKVLPIGDGVGFHPSFVGMKQLWDAKNVAIIRGVGYPNPNYSHFDSMDIWQSGDPAGDTSSGWIGRWLDVSGKDPLRALWLGSNVAPAFAGLQAQASAIPASYYGQSQLPPGSKEFINIYRLLQRQVPGADPIQQLSAFEGTSLLSVSKIMAHALEHTRPIPALLTDNQNWLAVQLDVVAQLIKAGLPTKAYGVSMGNFDTHAAELGQQAQNLKQVDEAITGFVEAMRDHPGGKDVVTVVYTEFGRRVQANSSGGTDHGSSNDVYVVGPSVKGGFYGDPASITHLDVDGNQLVTTDFRTIYSTLLEQVIGVSPAKILGRAWKGIEFL